jgi:alcohol dehydrogenase class IV
MQFEFATSSRILFGTGSVRQLGLIAKTMGSRVLLVTNLPGHITPLSEDLEKHGLVVVPFTISGEPTVSHLTEGVNLARKNGCDLVIGLGWWKRDGCRKGHRCSCYQFRRNL